MDRAVDRVTSDTDLGATDACEILNASGTDVYRITQLLTAGLLGSEKKRHVVPPTRWAITAVDDTVSKQLKKKISRYPPLSGIGGVFSAALYGNHIVCLLVPGGDWKFEMIEVWGGKQSLWGGGGNETIAVDGEGATKSGYSPIAGGAYYSARLAVAEYLESVRRSARVLVLRNVTGEYWAPLGTWVVRGGDAERHAGGREDPPVRRSSAGDRRCLPAHRV